MYTHKMENSITFPAVLNIRASRDLLDVRQLYGPFFDLGVVALAALRHDDARHAGEETMKFLTNATRFTIQKQGSVEHGRKDAFRPGIHTFVRDLSASRSDGLEAARIGTKEDQSYPVSRMALSYTMKQDRGVPVGEVGMSIDVAEHLVYRSLYARLSAETALDGSTHTLRSAIGYITHQGMVMPDEVSSFGRLAAMSAKLAAFPGSDV
jgi:hypothetical protein